MRYARGTRNFNQTDLKKTGTLKKIAPERRSILRGSAALLPPLGLVDDTVMRLHARLQRVKRSRSRLKQPKTKLGVVWGGDSVGADR